MYAVHKALTKALDAAPAYIAKADLDSERVDVIGSFYDNVIEGLHVIEVRKEPAVPWKQTVQVIAGAGSNSTAKTIELGLERRVPFSRNRCRHTSSKLQC